MASLKRMAEETLQGANRRLFWGAVWLALILIAAKAFYLGLPRPAALGNSVDYLRSLAAISFTDLWFVAGLWALSRVLISALARRPNAARRFSMVFVGACAFCCLYAVLNVVIFGVF